MKRSLSIIVLLLALLGIASSVRADRFWIGPVPWVVATANNPAHFEAPAGVTSWIDLRTPAECGTAGTALSGVAIFVTADAANLGANYTNLGTDPERQLTAAQRTSLGTALRMPQQPTSIVLADIFAEALTVQADPTGASRAKPLIPNDRLMLELWLGDRKVRSRQFDPSDAAGAVIRQQLQTEYRAARAAVQAGQLPTNFHRKILGYWVRKYGIAYRWFEPNDLPDEGDLPPSTTFTESWPTNGTTISSGQDLAWTEVTGDVEVNASAVRIVTTGSSAHIRCNTVLSGSDNYGVGVISNAATTNARYIGPACRYDGSADNCYCVQISGAVSDPAVLQIAKVVSGTPTFLGAGTNQNRSGTYKISASGTTITAYAAGASVESITDSSLSSGTYSGVVFTTATVNANLDSFEAGDLAASVSKIRPNQRGNFQNGMRGGFINGYLRPATKRPTSIFDWVHDHQLALAP
jgi:hypothetical protein